AGKTRRPPARHQQQPRSDRPVETGEPQIGTGENGREAIHPISGRIGDASGILAHLPSGVPVRVSKVPPPLLIFLESVMGAPSASLRLGPAGRCGCAAAWQIRVRSSVVLTCDCLMLARTCGGIPHQTELFSAYLIIFISAAENALNSPQASLALA